MRGNSPVASPRNLSEHLAAIRKLEVDRARHESASKQEMHLSRQMQQDDSLTRRCSGGSTYRLIRYRNRAGPCDQAFYAVSVRRLVRLRSGFLQTTPRGDTLAVG